MLGFCVIIIRMKETISKNTLNKSLGRKPLDRKFYIKLAIVPLGGAAVSIIIVGITLGFNFVFEQLEFFLSLVLFLSIVVLASAIVVPQRISQFHFDLDKHPFIVTFGLFANLIALIYAKPKFLLDFHPFQEDLSIILIAIFAWLFLPIFFKFEKSKFACGIFSPVFLILGLFAYTITIISILLFAMIDIIFILYLFLA